MMLLLLQKYIKFNTLLRRCLTFHLSSKNIFKIYFCYISLMSILLGKHFNCFFFLVKVIIVEIVTRRE